MVLGGKIISALSCSLSELCSREGPERASLSTLHNPLACSHVNAAVKKFLKKGQKLCKSLPYFHIFCDQAFSQTLKTDHPEGMFSHKIIRD